MDRVRLTVGAEMPDLAFTWKSSTGVVIPFGVSEPHSFSLRIGTSPLTVKTTGIVGADVAPNVVVAFTADENDGLVPGFYSGQLWARRISDGRDRGPLEFDIEVARSLQGWADAELEVVAAATVTGTDAL